MNKYHDIEYFRSLLCVMNKGKLKSDRTGTGTISYSGYQMRYDLSNNSIPLLTTKKMVLNSILHELIWFISGDTNIKILNDNNVKIWDAWADENGDLGPIYGYQWRNLHGSYDQLGNAIKMLKGDPESRRIIVNSWDSSLVEKQALPPCHNMFQFLVNIDKNLRFITGKHGYLTTILNIRSNDLFLGNPFNIIQYSILTHMIAQVTGLIAQELIVNIGDAHIYLNHTEQVALQLSRDPEKYQSPTLKLNSTIKNIDDFKVEDITIENYKHYPFIKAPVSI